MGVDLLRRARVALADAGQAEGLLRESFGGGAAEFRAVRVMASGLPHAQWNNADVTGPDPDLDAAHRFYAERALPWGLRMPAGNASPYGRRVASLRLMALPAHSFQPAPVVEGLELSPAGPDQLGFVVAIDAAAFEEDPRPQSLWVEPHLGAENVETVIAALAGRPVATAYTIRTDGRAGPALYLGGVAVLARARRRGIAAAIASWLLQRGFAGGADLAHLHADTETSARVFARIGFRQAGELDVYAEL